MTDESRPLVVRLDLGDVEAFGTWEQAKLLA
jgi:hypothetical protein